MSDFEEYHTCHFCGTEINKEGYEYNGSRHFLSDCRPDLVEHEIGDDCTWAFRRKDIEDRYNNIIKALPIEETCYAYQNRDQKWTKEHIHFYTDGPM